MVTTIQLTPGPSSAALDGGVSGLEPSPSESLGAAFSHRRREDAESGSAHQIAKKLGILFEAVVPRTPVILSVFEDQAKKILATPGINPVGSTKNHGPFADFVGADATSLWAAMTLGGPSTSIFLLACLLARAFDDPAVTKTIWVELVAEQLRRRIDLATGTILILSQTAMTHSLEEVSISREELRQWDASARAWLQTADSVMARESMEFRHNLLLLKRAPFPETSGSLYSNVTEAWTTALIAIEDLHCGVKSDENDIGSAGLIAMSAWHLYPPLAFWKRSPVAAEDIEITTAASDCPLVTLKAPRIEESEQKIQWPFILPYFQGKPVSAVGTITERLSVSDLHLVTFGSLLRLWGVDLREDTEPVARWMVALWKCVDKVKQRQARPQWLKLLASAASQLLDSSGIHKSHCRRLIDLGYRQGHLFLGVSSGKAALPWFGLRSRHLLSSLSEESPAECAIQYLREISSYGKLGPDDALITWISPSSKAFSTHLYTSAIPRKHVEYRTLTAAGNVVPDVLPELQADVPSKKRKGKKGKGKYVSEESMDEYVSYKYSRWIGQGDVSGESLVHPKPDSNRRRYNSYESSMRRDIDRFALDVKRGYSDLEASERQRHDKTDYFATHDRPPLDAPGATASEKSKGENWYSIQSLIEVSGMVQGDYKRERGSGLLTPASGYIATGLDSDGHDTGPLVYTSVLTSSQDFFRLWLKPLSPDKMARFEKKARSLRNGDPASLLSLDESMDRLISGVNPSLLWQFFEGSDPYDPSDFAKPVLELMEAERHANDELLRPLRNIAFATSLYSELDGATISPRVVTTGLANPDWGAAEVMTTRSQVFSCIAMMESGVDLKPEGMERVIGLSSGNSLFVLSHFLSDPAKQVSKSAVTRLMGNVGRPGISLLTASNTTPTPRSSSSLNHGVQFRPFDGELNDSFSTTSLQLSFTGRDTPIGCDTVDDNQSQATLVECVASVHDGPKRVVDLDLLAASETGLVPTLARPRKCSGCCGQEKPDLVEETRQNVTTADSWEEVLSVPPGLTIVRACGNVTARLAIASVLASRTLTEKIGSAEGLKGFVVLETEGNECSICIYKRLRQHVRRCNAQSLPFFAVV